MNRGVVLGDQEGEDAEEQQNPGPPRGRREPNLDLSIRRLTRLRAHRRQRAPFEIGHTCVYHRQLLNLALSDVHCGRRYTPRRGWWGSPTFALRHGHVVPWIIQPSERVRLLRRGRGGRLVPVRGTGRRHRHTRTRPPHGRIARLVGHHGVRRHGHAVLRAGTATGSLLTSRAILRVVRSSAALALRFAM